MYMCLTKKETNQPELTKASKLLALSSSLIDNDFRTSIRLRGVGVRAKLVVHLDIGLASLGLLVSL